MAQTAMHAQIEKKVGFVRGDRSMAQTEMHVQLENEYAILTYVRHLVAQTAVHVQIENQCGFVGANLNYVRHLVAQTAVHVQIENEYGFVGGDLNYVRHLVGLARGILGQEAILFTTDPPPVVQKGSLPGDEVFTYAPPSALI